MTSDRSHRLSNTPSWLAWLWHHHLPSQPVWPLLLLVLRVCYHSLGSQNNWHIYNLQKELIIKVIRFPLMSRNARSNEMAYLTNFFKPSECSWIWWFWWILVKFVKAKSAWQIWQFWWIFAIFVTACISGHTKISAQRHTIVSYYPKGNLLFSL